MLTCVQITWGLGNPQALQGEGWKQGVFRGFRASVSQDEKFIARNLLPSNMNRIDTAELYT